MNCCSPATTHNSSTAVARPRNSRSEIVETDAGYTVQIEMPGVPREAIDIQLNGKVLTVTGERPQHSEGTLLHRERATHRFERRFEVGPSIDRDTIEAAYENGVLSLMLRKAESAKPRKIAVG